MGAGGDQRVYFSYLGDLSSLRIFSVIFYIWDSQELSFVMEGFIVLVGGTWNYVCDDIVAFSKSTFILSEIFVLCIRNFAFEK